MTRERASTSTVRTIWLEMGARAPPPGLRQNCLGNSVRADDAPNESESIVLRHRPGPCKCVPCAYFGLEHVRVKRELGRHRDDIDAYQ